MADKNLQTATQVADKSEMTLDKALHYIQNGTGQASGSNAPIAVVKVPRKSPISIQSGIFQALSQPFTDEERAEANRIIEKATPELFDKVFHDKIVQVCLANNVKQIVDMKKVIDSTK